MAKQSLYNEKTCLSGDNFRRMAEIVLNKSKTIIHGIRWDGSICYTNDSSVRKLGYTRDEMLRLHIWDIDPTRSEDTWEESREEWRIDPMRVIESIHRRKDGSIFPVEVSGNYVEYDGERYIFAYVIDITKRKNFEKNMNKAKNEAELYLDLMSHDINNMNQISTGYLEIALDTLNNGHCISNESKSMIEIPYNTLLSVSRLIENVKKIQREKAGQYQHVEMNVCEVVRDAALQYSNVPGRDITININQPDEHKVMADELLKDVFLNLIGNAIKHSKGTLTIDISISTVCDDNFYCMISVEDNGPGVPDNLKKLLFENLNADNIRARGKGFGLYLIKTIVENYNGRFWLEDRVLGDYTKGTKSVVMIPIADSK